MYVEDALDYLARLYPKRLRYAAMLALRDGDPAAWTRRFVADVQDRVKKGGSLSSKQAAIVLRLLAENRDAMVGIGASADALDDLIACPVYRNEPYESVNLPREVRYIGGNRLAFRFKYIEDIVGSLKGLRELNRVGDALYDGRRKLWIVAVNRFNFDSVIKLIGSYHFHIDHAALEWLAKAAASRDCRSSFRLEGDRISASILDCEVLGDIVQHVWGGVLR